MKSLDESLAAGPPDQRTAQDVAGRESPGAVGHAPNGSGTGHDRDRQFEQDLVFLMSHLEHEVVGLTGGKAESKVSSAAKLARLLIEQIFLFSQTHPEIPNQAEAFEKAQLAYEAAKGLETDVDWVTARGFRSYFRPKKVESKGAEFAYQSAGQSLRAAMAAYFLLFAESFRDPARAKQWAGTFQVFLDDLKRRW